MLLNGQSSNYITYYILTIHLDKKKKKKEVSTPSLMFAIS